MKGLVALLCVVASVRGGLPNEFVISWSSSASLGFIVKQGEEIVHDVSFDETSCLPEVSLLSLSEEIQAVLEDYDFSVIQQLAVNVFRIKDSISRPYVTYFGDGRVPYICETTLQTSRDAFSCRGIQSDFLMKLGEIEVLETDREQTTMTVRIDNIGGDMSADITEFFPISFERLFSMSNFASDAQEINEKVIARRDTSRVWVGFIWFFVAWMAFEIILISAVWASWWFVWLKRVFKNRPILKWTIFLIAIEAIIDAFGGFGGMLAFNAVLITITFVASVYYCCKHHRIKTGQTDESEPVQGIVQREGCCSSLRGPVFQRPQQMSESQSKLLFLHVILLFIAIGFCVSVFFIWPIDNYVLWDRAMQGQIIEFIPTTIAKGVASMYMFDGYATTLKMNNVFWETSTEWCGTNYGDELTKDEEKFELIQVDFIEQYDIDMSIYERETYDQYGSVNDWFIRRLKEGIRPISSVNDDKVFVSPADARTILFNEVPDDEDVWIKGQTFTLGGLVGSTGDPERKFKDGAMAIIRLAPQDYHRFHSPISGVITKQYDIDGTLHSVNADGMTSKNYAIYNQRSVSIIETEEFGNVAFVAVGATCVGSVVMNYGEGDIISKGEELGYFQFGGSTVVLVFEKNVIKFDSDMLYLSENRVETLIQVGMKIGERK